MILIFWEKKSGALLGRAALNRKWQVIIHMAQEKIPEVDSVKGIVFDLKKYAVHDGPGIRTTVFLKGCPLRCWWCQNPESQNSGVETVIKIHRRKSLNLSYAETREVIGREVSVGEIMREIRKDILFYDESGGGVTISGGEPLMQPGFLRALLRECKSEGLHTAVDTSGQAPWPVLRDILPLVDLFLYDLKLMDDERHRRYTGLGNERILKNLRGLDKKGKPVYIRFAVIPGITDTTENVAQVLAFIARLRHVRRIDLLPYNFMAAEKYQRLDREYLLKGTEPPDKETMDQLKQTFEQSGIDVNVGG